MSEQRKEASSFPCCDTGIQDPSIRQTPARSTGSVIPVLDTGIQDPRIKWTPALSTSSVIPVLDTGIQDPSIRQTPTLGAGEIEKSTSVVISMLNTRINLLGGLSLLLVVCTALLAPSIQAQEAPLSPGQFDSIMGVRVQRPSALFRQDGTVQNLDDALLLTDASFRSLSLEARVSYAINQRMLLSLSGPVLRVASLTGESLLLPDITLERREQVLGPGDLALSFSFMPRPTPRSQWGATFSLRGPLGSDTTRLPLGSGIFGGHLGVFGYQTQAPYFVRASLSVGNESSFSPEMLGSAGGGLVLGRLSLEQELRGVAPLSKIPDVAAEARSVLTGVAPQRSSLSSVTTLSAELGTLRPLVSLQWLFAGQNEAKGLAYFVGLRVAPQRQGDHSSRSVP
jgi:hypothetical protein